MKIKQHEYEVRWQWKDENENPFGKSQTTRVKSIHAESAIAALKRQMIKDPDLDVSDKSEIIIVNVILVESDNWLDVYDEQDN